MKLVFFTSVIMLCILHCAYSLHIDQVKPSTDQYPAKRELLASQLHALPRKLRLLAQLDATIVGQESKGLSSAPAQKNQQKKNVLAAGTHVNEEQWRQGNDDDHTSALFTMDYARVRRRRPIHNKSLKPKRVAVATSTP